MRCALAFTLAATAAFAQGIVVDPGAGRGGVRLEEQRVRVVIADQAAETVVEQTFRNTGRREAEGVYLFPLPEGATASRFTVRMGGRELEGEILDANRAKEIYRAIVHRRRDPGLLEFAGRGCLRARIFPIPPGGRATVTLRFEQLLAPLGGLIEYRCPLRSRQFSPGPVKTSGVLDIQAKGGVATIFSPTHRIDVARRDRGHVRASFEESASPGDRDLHVLYSLGRNDFGLALATHRPAGEDGTFLMLIAPQTDLMKTEVLPRDIVFVLDTSGSMGERGGRKIAQAKAALGYALGRLHDADRFNVVAFATEARPFRPAPVAATKEHVEAALAFVEDLEAAGGTAIHDAMRAALDFGEPAAGRVAQVLFLTDGQPTVGPSRPDEILKAVAAANRARARLFVLGVGDDVNTRLLRELAAENGGVDHYVAESENIERKVSALCDKIAAPVLTDVTLDFGDVGARDVHPKRIGDLFRGQQLAVLGRYGKPGARAIRLRGKLGDQVVQFVYEGTFGDGPGRAFLPRLWAVRQVGHLLGEIQRNGEQRELVEEIKRLALRYGIVTPYTSFLATEDGEGGGPPAPSTPGLTRSGGVDADEAEKARDAIRGGADAGAGAVAGARLRRTLEDAERADDVTGRSVRIVAGTTFRWVKGAWEDAALADFAKRHPDAKRVTVVYLSEEYDALLADARLARRLSVGENVRLVHDGVLYEIVGKK